ncbi:MAG: hypothetical protein ACLFN8_03170 [Candidatus Woesearchaeota archaeon]
MDKKGDLSINIIVIAAIAMIILVVISVLVFRSGEILNQARECRSIGGECIYKYQYDSCGQYADENWLDGTYVRHATATCPEPEEQICCVPLR